MQILIFLILLLILVFLMLLTSVVAMAGFVVFRNNFYADKRSNRGNNVDEKSISDKNEKEKKALREMKNFMKYDGSAIDG